MAVQFILGKLNETNGSKRRFWEVFRSAGVPYLPMNGREKSLIGMKTLLLQQNFNFFLTKKSGDMLNVI
jgi:hypothetical protein